MGLPPTEGTEPGATPGLDGPELVEYLPPAREEGELLESEVVEEDEDDSEEQTESKDGALFEDWKTDTGEQDQPQD